MGPILLGVGGDFARKSGPHGLDGARHFTSTRMTFKASRSRRTLLGSYRLLTLASTRPDSDGRTQACLASADPANLRGHYLTVALAPPSTTIRCGTASACDSTKDSAPQSAPLGAPCGPGHQRHNILYPLPIHGIINTTCCVLEACYAQYHHPRHCR